MLQKITAVIIMVAFALAVFAPGKTLAAPASSSMIVSLPRQCPSTVILSVSGSGTIVIAASPSGGTYAYSFGPGQSRIFYYPRSILYFSLSGNIFSASARCQ